MLLQGLSKGPLALIASVLLVWMLVGAFEYRTQEPATAMPAPVLTPSSWIAPAAHRPTKRI